MEQFGVDPSVVYLIVPLLLVQLTLLLAPQNAASEAVQLGMVGAAVSV